MDLHIGEIKIVQEDHLGILKDLLIKIGHGQEQDQVWNSHKYHMVHWISIVQDQFHHGMMDLY